MKKSILNLEDVHVLNQEEQKLVNGSGYCCTRNSAWDFAFPSICRSLPPCQER